MSTENQGISVVLIYTLMQFELHLQAEIGLRCSTLQYWEAIMCFNLKTCIQMVYLWSQNVQISMSWFKFATQPSWWLCWHKIEILFSVCKGLGFIPASSKRINTLHDYPLYIRTLGISGPQQTPTLLFSYLTSSTGFARALKPHAGGS